MAILPVSMTGFINRKKEHTFDKGVIKWQVIEN